MVDMRVSFIKSPDGSFPDEPDTKLTSDDEVKTSTGNSRRFCIGKESFAYQELRELRLPSVQTVKRNVKTSVQKLRCQGRFRSGSTGIITFDDYTADLYGCDNDDELPLLVGSNADESTN
jgi:hypothetical protein